MIGQYALTIVYWPNKSRDYLGPWRQSSTGHESIILDIDNLKQTGGMFISILRQIISENDNSRLSYVFCAK
jgi:hypothetical protein